MSGLEFFHIGLTSDLASYFSSHAFSAISYNLSLIFCSNFYSEEQFSLVSLSHILIDHSDALESQPP